MALFDFKLANHFVGSSDGASLQVYELTKSSADFSSIHKADWKQVATINPQPDDDVVAVDGGHACDGLRFFDERIEEAEVLTMLAQHLKQLRLLASPEGYCFQQVSDFGVHYLRLNDLFSWPRYGVKLVTVNTTWSRLELELLKDEDDHELDIKTELQKSTKSRNINVLIGQVGELQRQLKEKDAELLMLQRNEERIQEVEKLNDALEMELQKLKNMIRELQRQLKRKDDQVEMLNKKLDSEEEASEKRIAELEDSEEENRAKDKRLQKLNMLFKNKDLELEALKKKTKEKLQRLEELEKMKEELEGAKQDDEVSKLKKSESELRKLLKLKDKESEARKNEVVRLRKEKDDEILGRLPVVLILRCTAVCKDWNSLIRSSDFISHHSSSSNADSWRKLGEEVEMCLYDCKSKEIERLGVPGVGLRGPRGSLCG
ncbi:hypothetical protein LINGRAHAP2_LOCUS8992 [Linum grandiflorum]